MQNSYDDVIGYSPLEEFDEQKLARQISINFQVMGSFYARQPDDVILVAGAGVGKEAVLVYEETRNTTYGVDLNIRSEYVPSGKTPVLLQVCDLSNLSLIDEVFNVIYSFHVLEHVPNHMIVLKELNRVLYPEGILFIGFPNKNRLVSYIGTSQKVGIINRIRWNLRDYQKRLSGQFENQLGAHAGFSQKEFLHDATSIFSKVIPVRDYYMKIKYPGLEKIFIAVSKLGLSEFLFPSNYFICFKGYPHDNAGAI
jgi:ubiquinone/menaquinone biosynthesis C-methylase UbiE